jgi:hypothetical protein
MMLNTVSVSYCSGTESGAILLSTVHVSCCRERKLYNSCIAQRHHSLIEHSSL